MVATHTSVGLRFDQGLNNTGMRTEEGRNSKSSWPKKVVRKWLNLPPAAAEIPPTTTTEADQLNPNYNNHPTEVPHIRRRRSCSDKDGAIFMRPGDSQVALSGDTRRFGREEWLGCVNDPRQSRVRSDNSAATIASAQNHRIFVGTWNVGGRAPSAGLDLGEWLSTPAPADIYVLGFQEIVPLNAGNVLGAKDRIPAARWLSLIRQALNFPKRPSTSPTNYSEATIQDRFRKPRVSFSDLISIEDMLADEEFAADDDYAAAEFDLVGDDSDEACANPNSSDEDSEFSIGKSFLRRGRGLRSSGGFHLAGSKQMVGIFLCVWICADLLPHLTRLKVSCVARGAMGYMGNKGSISISMTLRSTTFCFVCTHLTSGEKERDEAKRNFDVMEIMRRTRFPRSRTRRSLAPELSPKTILEHDKIIWLGDLNYRLTASCEETHELLMRNDWNSLLEKDQLRMEQKAGRIFTGWEEGKIYFPPTYKYVANSDLYAVQTDAKPKHKKRTPAWCDRILWRGEGMKQVCYVRGESQFSDHRPVYSIFSVRVVDLPREWGNQAIGATTSVSSTTCTGNCDSGDGINKIPTTSTANHGAWPVKVTHKDVTSNGSSTCAKIEAEEMFPVTRTQSCMETSRF